MTKKIKMSYNRFEDMMGSDVTGALHAKVRLNENGRIVIPAEMRQKLGIGAGDSVFLTAEGESIKIESHRARVRRVQEEFKKFAPKDGTLVSDQLIADRREEARREMEEALGKRSSSST